VNNNVEMAGLRVWSVVS